MTAKEIRRRLPQDSHDVAGAREFISLDPEHIRLVLPDMLRQLKDIRSPVAQVYCEYLADHGEAYAGEVAEFLGRARMDYQKFMIVGQVLPGWSGDAVAVCANPLQMLVTHNSGTLDTD